MTDPITIYGHAIGFWHVVGAIYALIGVAGTCMLVARLLSPRA